MGYVNACHVITLRLTKPKQPNVRVQCVQPVAVVATELLNVKLLVEANMNQNQTIALIHIKITLRAR